MDRRMEHLSKTLSHWKCDLSGIWLYWFGNVSDICLNGVSPRNKEGKSADS
jgi:hypothetical protein